nr:hypothetical protein [Actinomycetota bacterium]
PGDEVQPRGLRLSMSAEGVRGYSVSVETRGHHRVTMRVRKGVQLATYTVRGTVTRRRIEADFGRFGRVRLRFRGSPRRFAPARTLGGLGSLAPRRRCTGKAPEREVGRFRGSLEFEGQRGFTRLAVGEARGEVRRFYRRVCERRAQPGPLRPEPAVAREPFGLKLLIAHAREGGVSTRFVAIGFEAPFGIPQGLFPTFVSANLEERVGRVRVTRSAFLLADGDAVQISRRRVRPVRARVEPPAPFGGVATFKGGTGPSPAAWTGSLRVRLAGSGRIPLTGPGYDVFVCRVALISASDPCLRRAEASSLALLRAAAPLRR